VLAFCRQWVSSDQPTDIRGLALNKVYTLVETRPSDGYALAENIQFKLVQRVDSDGDLLDENDVYVCTGKDWLIFDHWEKLADGMVIMRDDITRIEISKQDITTKKELPGAHLTLKDADGNVIESWVSTDTPHSIEKLPAGWYELSETQAPDGYLVAESIRFEVLPTGEIQKVTMYDERKPEEPGPTPTPTPQPPAPSVPHVSSLIFFPVSSKYRTLSLIRQLLNTGLSLTYV